MQPDFKPTFYTTSNLAKAIALISTLDYAGYKVEFRGSSIVGQYLIATSATPEQFAMCRATIPFESTASEGK